MCGRFALFTPTEQIAETFDVNPASAAEVPPAPPRYNIAPTQPVAAIRLYQSGERELTFFQWGLVPSWAKDPKMGSRLINARAETVAEKPSFRAAFKRRRCLIPADGFYEWQKQNGRKQPIFIYPADDGLFALAGLWEMWQSDDGSMLQTCTILTTKPNEVIAPIHNRMPVVLQAADYDDWLHPDPQPEQALHLLRPFPAEKMATRPVSTFVNNPRNDSPDCIAPLE